MEMKGVQIIKSRKEQNYPSSLKHNLNHNNLYILKQQKYTTSCMINKK